MRLLAISSPPLLYTPLTLLSLPPLLLLLMLLRRPSPHQPLTTPAAVVDVANPPLTALAAVATAYQGNDTEPNDTKTATLLELWQRYSRYSNSLYYHRAASRMPTYSQVCYNIDERAGLDIGYMSRLCC